MPILKVSRIGGLAPWTKIPNFLIDHLMPTLRDTEVRVLLVLMRSTVGWNREGEPVTISYAVLQRRTGRSSEAISNALRSLEGKGLIHISGRRFGRKVWKAKVASSEGEGH